MTWLETTRELLANRPRILTLKTIADEAAVPLPWLQDFSRGKTESPGIVNVQKLHDYLAARKP